MNELWKWKWVGVALVALALTWLWALSAQSRTVRPPKVDVVSVMVEGATGREVYVKRGTE